MWKGDPTVGPFENAWLVELWVLTWLGGEGQRGNPIVFYEVRKYYNVRVNGIAVDSNRSQTAATDYDWDQALQVWRSPLVIQSENRSKPGQVASQLFLQQMIK